ncbi:tail fiber domain-containing protein [Runella sp.]|uniref:tail fiber domain-containing protein n=1 Tax=Runella sp. TaxID=1960881 RepID=UPI003D0CF116
MKKVFIFIFLTGIVLRANAQIFTQSTGGSITLTPKGLQGSANPGSDTTNVALGSSALRNVTDGRRNVALGSGAMIRNTSGDNNTAIGHRVLNSNTGGSFNIAVGGSALFSNTSGSHNIAVGMSALIGNTEGNFNSALGYQALSGNDTGRYNTALGMNALYSNTSGNTNIALGYSAGSGITTGSDNTFLGHNADASSGTISNAMALGYNAVVNVSNKVRIGNSAVTVIEGAVPFSTPSDRRLKQNILYTSALGLNFITRLQPASYTYIADETNVRHDGLIAQDVEKVMQELGLPFSGLQKAPDGRYSLAYSDFVMPLINAVKEQQQEIDELKNQVKTLMKLVESKQ